jgi:aspartyl/asparaginyl beta-hydroxylase
MSGIATTGWLVITLLLLMVIGVFVILSSNRVRGYLYPYLTVLSLKYFSTMGLLFHSLRMYQDRLAPREYFRALGRHSLQNFKRVATVCRDLDKLPTVSKGNRVLGLRTALEAQTTKIFLIKSPYTNELQRPYFFIPGVPSKTFYNPNEFEWVRPLEESFSVVKQELRSLLESEKREFKEYRSESATILPGWNTFNLFIHGEKVEENCSRCPQTVALLESLPRFEKQHIMFSALNPRTHLPAHFGPMNGILRGHLPLIVPEGCRIRVGQDERTWQEGKMLVFDDSYNHEVWNDSDHVRIVLFLNFWHPCFADEELPVLERIRRTLEVESPTSQNWRRYQLESRADTLVMAKGERSDS